MDLSNPMREVYWNITGKNLMYVLLVPVLVAFFRGFYSKYRLWKIGRPTRRRDNWRRRLAGFFRGAVVQEKNFRDRYSGWMHFFIWGGMLVLFIGTANVALDEYLGVPTMEGLFYLYFQSLVLDVFGLLAIVGLAMALYRRYVVRPPRLHRTPQDAVFLGLLLLVLVTGFVIEGLRIAVTEDPWAAWSPVGWAFAAAFRATGMAAETMVGLHRFSWWFHLALAFAWIACVPYTKLTHLVTSPANIYMRSLGPKGRLEPINLETAEFLGASNLRHFTWKQLFDLDACTECGRCQDACPAHATLKPLNPKAVVLDLRDYMHEYGPLYLRRAQDDPWAAPAETPDGRPVPVMVGAVIAEDALWSCTTCRACMEACPVEIEHVPAIMDMRRFLAMDQASMPEGMADAIRSLETRGHPFRGTGGARTDWLQGLDVPVLDLSAGGGTRGAAGGAGADGAGPDADFDVLWWVGCAMAFDERNQKVARSLARVLHRAGVRFAILGNREKCTGDAARRIGHEYLFQTLAGENVATLNQALGNGRPRRIVTACPHCYNTLKHEYPDFGGHYDVVHHTEFIRELVDSGRLKLDGEVRETITFHDPCYLGRYNDVYDAPRKTLKDLSGAEVREIERARESSFCCGGGGALVFVEERIGTRINQTRARQAAETGARTVCTACPFCMTMLADGLKTTSGDEVQALDLAELVDRATAPAGPAAVGAGTGASPGDGSR